MILNNELKHRSIESRKDLLLIAMDATSDRAPSPGNVDDLFDYDAGLDEIFKDNPTTASNADASKPATGDPTALGLGLDEEVKVTKKRQPAPKLDEARYALQPLICPAWTRIWN